MEKNFDFSKFHMTKVDFHSHILPKLDDGSRSAEESLMLIDSAKKNGVELIIATPHFYGHRTDIETFIKNREKSYNLLMEKSPKIPIFLGAEVLVFPGLENMEGIEKLAIGEDNILLLEMPLSESLIYEDYFDTVLELSKKFKIVMAHANRYSDKTVIKMIEAGAILQVNSEDVCSIFERKRIRQWMMEDLIFALGSDVHRNTMNYKKYKKAIKIIDKIKRKVLKG